MKEKKIHKNDVIIIQNRQAKYNFFLEKKFNAGIVLYGWEVKSLRAKHANINNSYIFIEKGEAFLFNAIFTPLDYIKLKNIYNPSRVRKLLLKKTEINSLYTYQKKPTYTIVAISMYWKYSWVKLTISTARGKKKHDKRNTIKNNAWKLEKSKIICNKQYYSKQTK